MNQPASRLHLVLGEEELLVERAVTAVLQSVRRTGGVDMPVSRVRAGDVGTHELAELLSPSLFSDERVVVLEAAGEAGKAAADLIAAAAADVPSGTVLVVVHSGGGRAKALAAELRKLGAEVHACARIVKAAERVDFLRSEFRSLRVKVDDETVTALLDAVGSDVRELASACSQLVADTNGQVDAAAVRRYHSGKAEVKGFDIADKAVTGDVAGAAEALRWAMMPVSRMWCSPTRSPRRCTRSQGSLRCPATRIGWQPTWTCHRGGCRKLSGRPGGGRWTPWPPRSK